MADTLMKLELGCYCECLGEEEKVDRMKRSSDARDDLTSTADQRQKEVKRHIVSQNAACAGLITWMKSGVTSDIVNPTPINFNEALSYLRERETYESTGSEVFDFYGLDVDTQFNQIMKILNVPSRQDEEPKTR